MKEKEYYMRRALELAQKGEGYTSPNPMVGCVVVKNGAIIGEGYHEHYGAFHAERNALLHCKEDPKGAELYVTLEPCCHYGKTPPCTEIIMEKKIKKVYVGSLDSNPLVAGKGIQILKDHGIEVETGILEQDCLKLNEVFYHYIQTKMPFIAMKYAMTLDGKIACISGDSKWITGEKAREDVHKLRKRYKGIMVGIGTVLSDNPMLNCRMEEGVDPVRIICDSSLKIPLESQIVRTAKEIETMVVCTENAKKNPDNLMKIQALEEAGIQILTAGNHEKTDLKELMIQLGEKGIDGILLEGGGTLNAAMLEEGFVSKVYAYIAGKIIGGESAPSPIRGAGVQKMAEAIELQDMEIERMGKDICIIGYLKNQ